jgi:hypothetical protein
MKSLLSNSLLTPESTLHPAGCFFYIALAPVLQAAYEMVRGQRQGPVLPGDQHIRLSVNGKNDRFHYSENKYTNVTVDGNTIVPIIKPPKPKISKAIDNSENNGIVDIAIDE